MRKYLLIIIALLCAVAQGAWAQTEVSTADDFKTAVQTDGANITLTQDINISSAITIGDDADFKPTVTINLGGHTLNRGCTSRGSQVIGVFTGSTLYLSNGTVTGGWGGDGGGILNKGGTMHLTDVIIDGNTADDRGGGISNNGTLTMTGCTVSNNTSRDVTDPAGGGGIFNYNGKEATLTNCTITGNTANTYAGGGICNYGTMTLNNCSVTDNNANTKGGGIFCSTTSTLSINGITVTGNSAVSYGDGIYIDNSTLNMQGLCTVKDNTDSNIYLYGSGTKITVTGAFTDGSNIGLGSSDNIRAYTSGYSTYNSATPDNYFSFDNGSYAMGLKNGEVYPSIYYVECSWDGGDTDGHVVSTNKICTDYSQYNGETELSDGWYLLSGSHTGDDEYKKRITIDGDVNFILQDGCDVEFDKGIFIKENKTLTIYGQTAGTGYLHTDGSDGENGAIGGNEDERGGNVVIHGGKIYAKPGSNNCAAIGAGNGKYGMQSITIYGGNIAAEGKSSGAGIGGGQKNRYDNDPYFGSYDYTYTSPSVTIYGGTIMAKGGNYAAGIGGGEGSSNGDIRIYGGNITATAGKYAAGIGSGENTDLRGEIFIYGGTVKATGGEYGAGIGAGKSGESSYRINIYGGNITATAGKEAAGIGGGGNGGGHLYGCITIEGGTVTAEGGEKAAGIGSGKGGTIKHESADYSMYFSGGNIYATGGKYGPGVGIGSEGSIEIRLLYMTGGHLEAKSRGGDAACIGGGKKAPGSTVVINSGTVKCIYTNEYSNEYDKKYPCQYVGQGGSNEDLDDGSFSLGEHTHTVYKDGNRMTANNRYGAVQSHPGGNSTVSIEYCDHDGASYAYVNDTYHRYYCSYCTSSSQQHDGNPCSKCELGSGEYTVTLYEANEDGTGYSTTPIVETLGYQNKYTLPQCGTVPTNKEFMGWKKVTGDAPATIEAEDSELSSLESAGSSFNISENVTYYARYQTCWTGSGTGSSDNPYLINNKDDWDYLADKVNSGNFHYKGKYFKLTDNISVTSQVSKSEGYTKYFSGIFYGDSHTLTYTYSGSSMGMAPFGYAKNATFSDLHVAGSINISGGGFDRGYSGGLVSCMTGSNTISNCRSSVQINSNRDCNGGFVADLQNGSVTVTRCIFDGKLTGSGSNSSGFVGMQPSGYTPTINISNSLFIPSQVSMGTNESYTFASSEAANVTIDNCYYSQTFGTAQGTKAYTVSCGTNDLWLYYGELNYSNTSEAISDLQHFENEVFPFDAGLLFQAVFYTSGTSEVTFTPLTSEYGQGATDVTASAGTLTNNGDGTYTLAMNNANSNVTATITTLPTITLYDVANDPTNADVLTSSAGQTANVTISGRKLYKDGDWNTLCLPFDVSENFIKNNDHPLHGATIMELDTDGEYDGHHTGFDTSDGTLYLYFKEVNQIDARRPYLVKWTTTGDAITSPVFYTSTIEASIPKTVRSEDGTVSFIGNFNPVELAAGQGTYYLGTGNKLYYPSTGRTMNAFRAYFTVDLSNGITAGTPQPEQQQVRAFVLNFGDDGETTGIVGVEYGIMNIEHSAAAGWYDLSGRKLSKKPTAKGIYIYNGKKVAIK